MSHGLFWMVSSLPKSSPRVIQSTKSLWCNSDSSEEDFQSKEPGWLMPRTAPPVAPPAYPPTVPVQSTSKPSLSSTVSVSARPSSKPSLAPSVISTSTIICAFQSRQVEPQKIDMIGSRRLRGVCQSSSARTFLFFKSRDWVLVEIIRVRDL